MLQGGRVRARAEGRGGKQATGPSRFTQPHLSRQGQTEHPTMIPEMGLLVKALPPINNDSNNRVHHALRAGPPTSLTKSHLPPPCPRELSGLLPSHFTGKDFVGWPKAMQLVGYDVGPLTSLTPKLAFFPTTIP